MAQSNGIHNENSNSKNLPELKTTKPITLDSSGIMAKAWVSYFLIVKQKRFIKMFHICSSNNILMTTIFLNGLKAVEASQFH